MNSFISYNSYKKSLVLNETYESYVELKELAQLIFKKYHNYIFFPSYKSGKLYPIMKFVDKHAKFKTINDFIENWKTGIVYMKLKEKEFSSTAGSYVSYHDFNILATSDDQLTSIKENFNGVIVLYKLKVSTILHELQHCYDDYRSKGKFVNSKAFNQFSNLDRPSDTVSFSGKTPGEAEEKARQHVKKIQRYITKYTKLPHEISAFFIQTIEKIDFFTDMGKQGLYIRNIHLVWEEFKEKYQNYDILTPNIKKEMARKFSQYYHKIKEELQNKDITMNK